MINKSGASWLLHALIQLQPGDYDCILPSPRLSLSLRLTIECEGPSLNITDPQCFQTVSNCNSEKFSRSGPIIKQSEGAATVLGSIIFHQNSNKISTSKPASQPASIVTQWGPDWGPVGVKIIISGEGGASQANQQYFCCIKTIKPESVRGGEHLGPATPMMKTKTWAGERYKD